MVGAPARRGGDGASGGAYTAAVVPARTIDRRALALLLAASLAATTAGPACLVLACPMAAPCEAMVAMEAEERCCGPEFSGPTESCCEGGGLTATLRKPASEAGAPAVEPVFAGLPSESLAGEPALLLPPVPPAPPPDGGLYTLHSTFLI